VPSKRRIFMRAIRSRWLVFVAAMLAIPIAALADAGTVWLTGTIEGNGDAGRFRIPLEWLAAVNDQEGDTIRVEDVTVDVAGLWKTYRELPAGESRRVEKGISKKGNAYDVHVVSETPARTKARGKVRILNRDEKGKVTDIGFPLDIPGLIQTIANSLVHIEGGESKITVDSVSLNNPADLRKLADYGPFTFFEGTERDSSRVKIWIE
jgi:hypothetical protein